jgi:hypothetical protein
MSGSSSLGPDSFGALIHMNSDEALDLLAERLASRLADRQDAARQPVDPAPQELVGVRAVAAELGLSEWFVYEHADELGVRRLGTGPKAPLRFDLEEVRRATVCSGSKRSDGEALSNGGRSTRATGKAKRRSPNGSPKPGSILAVRDRNGATR